MKKLSFALGTCALALLLTVSACKKDNTSVSCGSGILCAHVDGVAYTAKPYNSTSSVFGGTSFNGSYARLVASSNSTGGYYFTFSGNNGDANDDATYEISGRITQLPVAGSTYSTAAGSASFDYYAGSSSNQLHYESDVTHPGTVTITKIDTATNLVSGTFSFDANTPSGQSQTPATHSITSGSFTDLIIRR